MLLLSSYLSLGSGGSRVNWDGTNVAKWRERAIKDARIYKEGLGQCACHANPGADYHLSSSGF